MEVWTPRKGRDGAYLPRDKAKMRKIALEHALSAQQMERLYGVGIRTASRWLKEWGVTDAKKAGRHHLSHQIAERRRRHPHMSVREIADYYGVSRWAAERVLEKAGLMVSRGEGVRIAAAKRHAGLFERIERFDTPARSCAQVAVAAGVATSTVARYRRAKGARRRGELRHARLWSRETPQGRANLDLLGRLCDLILNGKTGAETARRLGRSESFVTTWWRRHRHRIGYGHLPDSLYDVRRTLRTWETETGKKMLP